MKLRIAVLGCGYWGRNLVRNFGGLRALAMVCDPADAGRATANQLVPGVKISASFDDAMQSKEIDAVAIAAPAALHYSLARAALQAGKAVFVEKPLCLQEQEGQELVQLASAGGQVLMVGHLLQYHPCVQALHALLAQGELGKLHYIISNRLNLGKIRREENALWSFAPHDISVILSLCGGQTPEQVRCTGGEYLNKGVADTTLTALRFSSGVGAHVFVSWLNPFKEQKLTVVGSSGIAVFDDTKPWAEKLVLYRQYITWADGQTPTPQKRNGEPVATAESEPLRNECEHFIECCVEKRPPRTDGQEGLRVLSVLQAAQWSLENDGESVARSTAARGEPGGSLSVRGSGSAGNKAPAPAQGARAADGFYRHPTAVVDEGATIGKGTKIWHFCHIMKGATIGESCVLGQNVNVDADTRVGNNVKIQNNVSVYSGVEIEDDVFLGPSCVLTNVSNPRSQVNRHSLYEKTVIRRGATVGANATIVCGVTIGRYAFVAAGSVVTRDVPDYALVMGNPARQKGWMSRHAHVLQPGDDGVMTCPEAGLRYQLDAAGRLRCLDLDEDGPLPAALRKGVKSYGDLKRPAGA